MFVAKTLMLTFISFTLSVISGIMLIPILKKLKAGQSLSIYLERTHKTKQGTPTMGGLIFIIPTIIITILLLILNKMTLSINLIIIIFTFISYALIGFIDDYLIIKRHNNKGLTVNEKFILQIIVAVIFFYFFMKAGNEPLIWIHTLGIKYNIGFIYGIIILFILTASSNAVNISDGLDGLCTGLSIIALITLSIITYNTEWLEGYKEITLFSFILVGSLLGFLIFNNHPAKIFMGDTGSLALGATLGSISILTRHEILLIILGIVFVIETTTCILQIGYYKLTKKRLFPITPIHHTFEKYYNETEVVHIFWLIGILGAIMSIIISIFL